MTRTTHRNSYNTTVRPASDKQIAFATRLVNERDFPASWGSRIAEVLEGNDGRALSTMIDTLLAQPFRLDRPQAKPGYYVGANHTAETPDAYVVVVSKKSGNPYAKRLVIEGGRASWEYAPGVANSLAHLEPMTVEQAAAIGHAHGFCYRCCKQLTDPKSVAQGYGPVCITKIGY